MAGLALAFLNRPIRMLPMKVVFHVFGVSAEEQAAWALKEGSRDRLHDALTGFWNRPIRPRAATPVQQQLGPRRTDDGDEAGKAA